MLLLALAACKDPAPVETALDAVPLTATHRIPGLRCPAQVVRAEAGIPYIYAHDRADLARAQGYVLAQDRWLQMELARRLGLGTVAELLGEDALSTDMENRHSGMTWVAERILANLTPEQAEVFDGFAEGVNAWMADVSAGRVDPPRELDLAANLLGQEPNALLQPFDRRAVAGVAAVIIYELGYETGDVGRQSTADILAGGVFSGQALAALREAGATADLFDRIEPVWAVRSAEGWGEGESAAAAASPPATPGLPPTLLDRAVDRHERLEQRLGHDHHMGWGSNAWAVAGSKSVDGRALLAGDGHLPLSIPSLFYQVGLDTSLLGGGDTHQVGLLIPGLPVLAVGSNGAVAWSQTQLMGDITDWYAEVIALDENGLPASSLFQGEQKPLVQVAESVKVAEVALLGSSARTVTWTRFTTFDGRWIDEIEGTEVPEDYQPLAGESVVNMGGTWIVPGDTDGDGVVSALSFDYTGLDDANPLLAVDRFGHAESVEEVQEASRGLVAYSQNIVAADASGSIFYTGYQGVPCRGYLARNTDGSWAMGANPSRVLDGTTYGGFTIPIADNVVAEGSEDPYSCTVPFSVYPQSVDPMRGYVLTANNDPGGFTFDGSLTDEPWYIGGPWTEGYRADTIDQALSSAETLDIAAMVELQADTRSRLGEQFTPELLRAIELAREADPESRLGLLYAQDPEAVEDVYARLSAWDFSTPSGVETFYSDVAEGDTENAIATSIFNSWFGWWNRRVWDDEGLPDVWEPTGGTGRTRALTLITQGRGPNNPLGLASWNPATRESAFFDVLGTEAVETSEEVALTALFDALSTLETRFDDPDRSTWLWGMIHLVHFDSLLGDFLGDEYASLAESFSITPGSLPVDTDLKPTDPRSELDGYPRPGDNFSVDAANAGMNGEEFDYGSGPVFRMVIAMGAAGTEGVNVLPGGQAGQSDSPHFDDQAQLWLGNDTTPMHFTPADVVAAATSRELFTPGAGAPPCGL